jgi:hypothetical protein
MDEKPQVETADIEDALTSMLAVEPSPGFAARVRHRIAADSETRAWKSAQLIVPALAAAAVIVAGVLVIFSGTRRLVPEPVMPAAATRDQAPVPGVATPASEAAAVVTVQQEERPAALVPRNEIIAVQRLLSVARAGRFEYALVPAGVPVAGELSAPAPISLPPIEMMPIGASSSFE